jgi:hypothetical protein
MFSFVACSLGVLYGGLGKSKLQFLIKKIKIKIFSCKFFSNFWSSNPDPDPGSGSAIRKNAESGSIRIRIESMRIRNPVLNIQLQNVQLQDVKLPVRQVTGRPVIGCPDHLTSSLPNVQITILSHKSQCCGSRSAKIILLGSDRHPKHLNHSLFYKRLLHIFLCGFCRLPL